MRSTLYVHPSVADSNHTHILAPNNTPVKSRVICKTLKTTNNPTVDPGIVWCYTVDMLNAKGNQEMQATSSVKFDAISKKFFAFVGSTKVKSKSREYVERRILELGGGLAAGATAAAVTETASTSSFGITERFGFVEQMVQMVSSRTMASAIVSGPGGLGKTHTVLESLRRAGLRDVTDLADFEVGERVARSASFVVVKGFSTAKGLFRTLQENNGMVLVFDDCDSVLKDPIALNLLKGALDSYSDRWISWNADLKDDDLDKTFKFTGSIIFITNRQLMDIDQAIRTRAMCVDLSMTAAQKLERMETIARSENFMPDNTEEHKLEALELLREYMNSVETLSLRSLIQVVKIRATAGSNWKNFAKYVLSQGA